MADFTSEFWSWFVAIGTIAGLIYCLLLVRANNTAKPIKEGEEAKTMGHVWDGDLAELNNPLPKWWLNLFYITLIFAVVYLVLYPGLGTFQGVLDWSSKGRYDKEVAAAQAEHAPLYAGYLATPLDDLIDNKEAMGTAKRLFSTNCAVCHGSDARGHTGFPNLTDDDWLYGADIATIKATINKGRNGLMPSWSVPLGEQGIVEVTEYIYSLTHKETVTQYVQAGSQKYAMCVGCHGADAKGNSLLGAPNLADTTWLYGGSRSAITKTLTAGRNGIMPSFDGKLSESQIHLITAYLASFQPSLLKTQ